METVKEESWKFLLTKMLILFWAGANFHYLANRKAHDDLIPCRDLAIMAHRGRA